MEPGTSHADSLVPHISRHLPCLGWSVREIWGGSIDTGFVWRYFLFLQVLSRVLLFLFDSMALVLHINIETRKHQHFALNSINYVWVHDKGHEDWQESWGGYRSDLG